ncbi:MAG: hypothetical protein ACE37K_17145 [Planctomycetota bacterium]
MSNQGIRSAFGPGGWIGQALLGAGLAGMLIVGVMWLEPGPVERLMIGGLTIAVGAALLLAVWETRWRIVAGCATLLFGLGAIYSLYCVGW